MAAPLSGQPQALEHDIGYPLFGHPAAVVRDSLAGMTDAYVLRQAAVIGLNVPEQICLPN